MPTPKERFVAALKFLQELQDGGTVAIFTKDIPNKNYRQILVRNGFLKEVTKGWYIAGDPSEKEGESTSWYSAYWEFCARFIEHKFGSNWCVSPEQSLLIHTGNSAVPQQLLIRSPQGNNLPTPLPQNTSLFNMRSNLPPAEQVIIKDGIRIHTLQSALIYCSSIIYKQNPIDARTALSLIRDASELLPILLEKGHTTYAGRLAGAFRNMQQDRIANDILETLKQAGLDVREEDPFDNRLELNLSSRDKSPYVNRIKLMWQQMRKVIIAHFPKAPGIPADHQAYLKAVDDIYVTDAYHSLSIERYKVTPELIEKVSTGEWDLDKNEKDREQRDAMAARGYYLSFQKVKESIEAIVEGSNAGSQAEIDHSKWYRELFDPSVSAGILKVTDLAGYRNHQVYIGNSKHTPLSVDAMRDTMPVLFELLINEPESSVRAVLGHFVFVYIHPYMDGNGRMARFLMNVMLASGGYPWIVIPLEKREEYMQALEQASVNQNITEFVKLLAYLLEQSMQGNPIATITGISEIPGN